MIEALNYEIENNIRPDYDDPFKYNKHLYPGAENIRTMNNWGNSWIQLSANIGTAMLDGAEAMGIPQIFTRESRANIGALAVMSERTAREFGKPEFGLTETLIDGENVAVTEEVVEGQDHAFGRLLHFKREADRNDPPVLIVAPMSGHYATLLRDTVRQLLPNHDVYITDWKNARDVPVEEGEFGLDDYTDYMIDWIKDMGPDTNVVAVCQSTVPVLSATSYLAKTEPESQPNSMTLMGGPLDTRAAVTEVTKFSDKYPIEWFRDNVTTMVPDRYEGRGRLVYPGFMQLANFMGMNLDKHLNAHGDLFNYLVEGSHEKADKLKDFYDEYRSVTDMDRAFYLQTVDQIFKRHLLAKGEMEHRGLMIDPGIISKTAVLTVEAGNDDISAPGQTVEAQKWLTGLIPNQKYHLLQEGIGHYGIFNGSIWSKEIAPRITSFIRQTAKSQNDSIYSPVSSSSKVIKPSLWQS